MSINNNYDGVKPNIAFKKENSNNALDHQMKVS